MILQQQHQIVVERSFNPNTSVKAFGKTAQEAADKVFAASREYGYWDATKTYPADPDSSEQAPKPGSSRRSAHFFYLFVSYLKYLNNEPKSGS
ncbi:hypothetical protein QUB63_22530 [Microcoleus sp. ARI1-B5]|uniref:hypothetical protein n=1 Tax=unclassified Microcoleus TaxID=2642155 RepID=UPI002FD71DF8